MIKGLYTAASGMMLQMKRQDVIANNVANANTGGYKKDTLICKAFPDMLLSCIGDYKVAEDGKIKKMPPVEIGAIGTGAVTDSVVTDFRAGTIKNTACPTDLAISNNGYFTVNTSEGERYTRNGSFNINNEGLLVDSGGNPVLDKNDKEIYINGSFTVDKMGDISSGEDYIATLKIVDFENKLDLKKEGNNLLRAEEDFDIVSNPGILQGYQEASNVNAVKEMVSLINVVRAYEVCQKVVQAEDETLSKAIDEVGRVS